MSTYTGKTLKEISQLVAEGNDIADAIITLQERADAKPGTYKARRCEIAIEQLQDTGALDVKACFQGAKQEPAKKPAPKAKAAPKADPMAVAAKAMADVGMDASAIAAFLTAASKK